MYSAEDGKKVSSNLQSGSCRWIQLFSSETLILAVINFKSHQIKWSVNCEFELKGGKMVLEGNESEILDAQFDASTMELLVLQSDSMLTRLSFPFPIEQTDLTTTSILLMSKLSKHLNLVLRAGDELNGQFLKLLKLDDSIFTRISELDVDSMRKLLLFGGTVSNTIDPDSGNDWLSESEVLDWKSKLKKQHAELLVTFEDFSSILRSFTTNYPQFCPADLDKYLHLLLPSLEDRSTTLQHDLAQFLVWIEALVIPDANNQTGEINVKAFTPDSRALDLSKALRRSDDVKELRHADWLSSFETLKILLNSEFKILANRIDSVDLLPVNTIKDFPKAFDRILTVDPLILLNQNLKEALLIGDKGICVISLPESYLAHYSKYKKLVVLCKGSIEFVINSDGSTRKQQQLGLNQDMDNLFINPLSNQLYSFGNNSLIESDRTQTKLSIRTL